MYRNRQVLLESKISCMSAVWKPVEMLETVSILGGWSVIRPTGMFEQVQQRICVGGFSGKPKKISSDSISELT